MPEMEGSYAARARPIIDGARDGGLAVAGLIPRELPRRGGIDRRRDHFNGTETAKLKNDGRSERVRRVFGDRARRFP